MSKWISVKDQLPQLMQSVLYFDGVIDTGWYSTKRKFMNYDTCREAVGVTHWMPLPKEPVETKETGKPPKRTYGDLTVRELNKICKDHPECRDCPLDEPDLCTGYYWSIEEYTINKEVDL